MANYKKMYFKLFNGITDTIETLEKLCINNKDFLKTINFLKQLQIETEEIFINDESSNEPEDD